MKRTPMVLLVVLMFSVLAFVPRTQISHHELLKRKPTPTPPPTATPVPSGLTAPTLISPPNGSTVSGQVTFMWSAVPGAARYHLQAGLNPYFDEQSNIIEQWSLTEPSYSFYASSGFVFYFPHLYWRVQAIDANNVQGPWSEIWYFNLTNP